LAFAVKSWFILIIQHRNMCLELQIVPEATYIISPLFQIFNYR